MRLKSNKSSKILSMRSRRNSSRLLPTVTKRLELCFNRELRTLMTVMMQTPQALKLLQEKHI